MSTTAFARRSRPLWTAAAMIVTLALALSFPAVRAWAGEFLGLFRVQKIAVVQVNPADLPEQLGSSSLFQQMLADDVQFEEVGEPQEVASAAEASELAGIPVRLPKAARGEAQLSVQPGVEVNFNIDLPQVRALLQELGRTDIRLPDNLDNAAVAAHVPASVRAAYGECSALETSTEVDREHGRLANCTVLVQLPSPTVSAPPDLDIDRIAEAFLQLSGMTPEEAAAFSRSVDWSTTLVVPIPRYGVSTRDVPVDGVTGTMFQQNLEDHSLEYMLLWVKDDIVYALIGPGDSADALKIANSLEQ